MVLSCQYSCSYSQLTYSETSLGISPVVSCAARSWRGWPAYLQLSPPLQSSSSCTTDTKSSNVVDRSHLTRTWVTARHNIVHPTTVAVRTILHNEPYTDSRFFSCNSFLVYFSLLLFYFSSTKPEVHNIRNAARGGQSHWRYAQKFGEYRSIMWFRR